MEKRGGGGGQVKFLVVSRVEGCQCIYILLRGGRGHPKFG